MRRYHIVAHQAPGNGRFFFLPVYLLRRLTALRPLFVVLCALAVAACSSSDPQILQIDARLIAGGVPHGEAVEERLSVFVDVFDPDGEGELDTLTIAYEDFDLVWHLDESTWRYLPRDGQHWYGSDRLMLRGRSRVPRAAIVVTATDLSGRAVSRTVAVPTTVPRADAEDFARVVDGGLFVPREARRLYVTRRGLDIAPTSAELEWPLDDAERIVPWSTVVERDMPLFADATDGAEIFIIVEWSPWLWLESGPWRVGATTE